MKRTATIALFLLLGLFTTTSLATEVSVFGSKQYLRTKGKPDVYTDAFSAAAGPGRLIVRNGDQSGQNRVSSAVISVNGVQVFGPADFSQQLYALEAPVALSASNTLSVELRSKPGSYLMIQVVQEVDAPTVTLGATPATILLEDSSTLSWASNNATSAAIDQGIGPVSLSGSLSVSPTATTTYTITVTGPGGTATASATVIVDNPPPTVTLAASPESILEGQSSTLAWTSTRATSASIDHDVGPVPVNGTLNVSPAETATYTITVIGPGGTGTASATIQVQPQFPTCAATGGDFILSISQPQDGAEVPRDQGPCIQVAGSVDPAVGFPTKEGRRITINGEPALLNGDSFSGNACLAFGPNEILVQGVYWEQSCRDEGGQTVCELLERHAWAKLCVYYSHLGAVDVLITEPQDGGVVYTSPTTVRGIVSPPAAGVAVNNTPAQVDPQGRFQASVNLSPGSNAITATGTFNGNSASSQITLIFEDIPVPVVRITSPVNGAVLASAPITVTGTVNDDRIAVMVNGIAATVAGGVFTAANVPLQIGPNTITATGTNPRGTGSDSVSVTYQVPLPTATLTASPESILAGQSSALSWTTTNAANATIEPGIGVVPLSGTMSVSPAQTTTYTITATGPGGTATASATVTVTQPPPTVTLSASPESIVLGGSATLSWSSTNATSASIQPGIGDVPVTGSTTVSPTVTTTYAITVTGPGGTNTITATVSVTQPSPTVTLNSAPSNIYQGQRSVLRWSSTNATSASIDQGIGSVPLEGNMDVYPAQTTTYTITVTGPGGTATATDTITVETGSEQCQRWGGDFWIQIGEPQDGTVVPRDENPCLAVVGFVDWMIDLYNKSGVEITVNGSPANLDWNNFSAEICLGFGVNEILAEARFWEEACWEENGEQFCDWVQRYAWTTVCVTHPQAAPVDIQITSPEDGAVVYNNMLIVRGMAIPPDATVTVNGTALETTWDGRFEASVTLSPGSNTIRATATSGAQTAVDEILVTFDYIPTPVVSITSPPSGTVVHTTPITVTGTINTDRATVQVNGIDATVGGGVFTAAGVPLQVGSNYITAVATNIVGTSSDTSTVTYTIVPPTVRITSPLNGATVRTDRIAVSGTVDDSSATVRVNGITATVASGTFSATGVPLQMGQNTITATATNAGGTGTHSIQVFRDEPLPPLVRITDPPDGEVVNDQVVTVWGTVEPWEARVWVNGIEAEVTGGIFTALDVPLRPAANRLMATGSSFGKTDSHAIWVIRPFQYVPQPAGSFGEQYEDLVPPTAAVEMYDPKRFAVVTGLVRNAQSQPLSGVSVTILDNPQYGTAFTDAQGRFAIPVEGGGTLTFVYQKDGFLTAHRKVAVPGNEVSTAETIVMLAPNVASTTLTFNGNPNTVMSHRSTPMTDTSGTRSATVVFTGDNRPYEVDDKAQPVRALNSVTVRATEYPTPESMPAVLPPTSGFTYCVELGVDEAPRVKFDKPVVVWVENFLGFDVGGVVPVGYYDRDRGVWVPSDNGRVVRLLDTNGDGIVDALDANGDGQPDDLNGNGSLTDEVQGLGDPVRYQPGATFWRFAVTHFTPWDCNWPYGPPGDAITPNAASETSTDDTSEVKMCPTSVTSSVTHRGQVLRDEIAVPGTSIVLHYASNRVGGHQSTIVVPASGASVPASLRRIVVGVLVAGRHMQQELDPLPNQVAQFSWDGLDFRGAPVAGPTTAFAKVGFVYEGVYYAPQDFALAFGQTGGLLTAIPARQEVTNWRLSRLPLRRGMGEIAQGWTLSNHHFMSPTDPSVLYKGDGTTAEGETHLIRTLAGTGTEGFNGDGIAASNARLSGPWGVTPDNRGNVYIADRDNARVRMVDPYGVIHTVAGNGIEGFSGDGGPAQQARLQWPQKLALDANGNLFIADTLNHRIRKVDANGIITTVAGSGPVWHDPNAGGYSGDGGLAVKARLNLPAGVAVDALGNIYIADWGNYVIRKVDPSGVINTVAGTGAYGVGPDGVPATDSPLAVPMCVALDQQGNLYIAENYGPRIRKVDSSGTITTVAGIANEYGSYGDGGPATQAALDGPRGVAVDGSGNVYIADSWNSTIRRVDPGGNITTVAGSPGVNGDQGDGGPATQAVLGFPTGVGVDDKGYLYFADEWAHRIRKVGPPVVFAPHMTAGDVAFPEENGQGHIMSSAGLHKKTVDLRTGVVVYEFTYDPEGRLVSFRDRFGNTTTITRDSNGVPTAILSPDGITTGLSVTNGLLGEITYPDGRVYRFDYTPDGLMSTKTKPRGNRFDRFFDLDGRLTDALDQEGGHWSFSRQAQQNGDVLSTVLTAEGNLTSYLDHYHSTGAYSSVITDPTAAQTLYSHSSDGLTVGKTLPCGLDLTFRYGADPHYGFKFVRETRERTQTALERVTLAERVYQDTNADSVPDRITESISVNGKTTTLVTDALGSVKTLISPLGRTAQSPYDPDTLLTTSMNIPDLYATSLGYDTRGRLTSISTNARHSAFTYDGRGNLSTFTDPLGRIITYDYDLVGRMTGIHRPDGSALGFQYDPNGNMTVLTVPSGVGHGFGYNLVDLNNAYQTPLSGSYTYLYDRDRRLKEIDFPSGRVIRNIYANGRLAQIQTPEGNIDFSYLCGSKVGTISRAGEAVSYGYDGSLLTSETLTGTLYTTLGYTYNNDFKVTGFTYAGGTVGYAYDNDGLLVGSGAFAISRDAGNGLPGAVAGGTLNLSRGFNGYGELDAQNVTVAGQNLVSWSLGGDNSGRITSKTESVAGVANAYDYTYDPMGRLRTVTRNGSLVEEYQYDASGRRSFEFNALRGIAGRNYGYSIEDHLLTVGDTAYQYDFDGFLTAKTRGTALTQYFYSSRGELLGVILPNGAVVEYVHDPLGRRITKKVNGAVTEKYLWQGMTRLLAVYDGSNNLVMRFLYADARMPVAMTSGANTYYLSYDQVGTLRVVTDSAGNVVKRIDYDSFGNNINDTNPAVLIPFGFAGGLHDRDTGLVRFGYRDYDPDTGRWSAKDPIRFRGAETDLYGYVSSDPIQLSDPLGLIFIGSNPLMFARPTPIPRWNPRALQEFERWAEWAEDTRPPNLRPPTPPPEEPWWMKPYPELWPKPEPPHPLEPGEEERYIREPLEEELKEMPCH